MTDGRQNDRTILVAEDDPEDCELIMEASKESDLPYPVTFVHDGVDLLEYLTTKRKAEGAVPPVLILLDLNMPKMGGHDALKALKDNPDLADLPVVVLSTSNNPEDVAQAYKLGARSYVVKPATFTELIEKFRNLGNYWFKTVALPGDS